MRWLQGRWPNIALADVDAAVFGRAVSGALQQRIDPGGAHIGVMGEGGKAEATTLAVEVLTIASPLVMLAT